MAYAGLASKYRGAFQVETGNGTQGEIVFYGRGGYATVVDQQGSLYKSTGGLGLIRLPNGFWEIDLRQLTPLS